MNTPHRAVRPPLSLFALIATLAACGGGGDSTGPGSARPMSEAEVRNYTTAGVLQSVITDLYAQQTVGFAGGLMVALSDQTRIANASTSCDNAASSVSVSATKGVYVGWRANDSLSARFVNCLSAGSYLSGDIDIRTSTNIPPPAPFATSLSASGLDLALREFSLNRINALLPANGNIDQGSFESNALITRTRYSIPSSGWSIRVNGTVLSARNVTQTVPSEDNGSTRSFATAGTYSAEGITLHARVINTARANASSVSPSAGAWEITQISAAPVGARIVATVQANGTQVLLQADTDGNGNLDSSQLVSSAALFN